MEIIAKVSRGTKMDQIYLPKNRFGLNHGSYVLVREIAKEAEGKLFFYKVEKLEKIKILIIKELFSLLRKYDFENIIITGSFLDPGFDFNDIDIILIKKSNISLNNIKNECKENIGINVHLIIIDNNALLKGLSQDPLFQTMMSNYVSSKRFIFNVKTKINFKLLDLNLLKSKSLIENFDILNTKEKIDLLRNLVSINLFIVKRKLITKDMVSKKIKEIFGNDIMENLKNNNVNKTEFIKKYKEIYEETFNKILEGIKNESEQK